MIEEAKTMFATFDTDGKGQINSFQEVWSLFLSMGVEDFNDRQ